VITYKKDYGLFFVVFMNMKKRSSKQESLFGEYNAFIDVFVHVLLSLIVSLLLFYFTQDLALSFLCFLLGIFLDLDHLLNPTIAKLIKLKGHESNIAYQKDGYVSKILHGFDAALLLSLISLFLTDNYFFFIALFLNFCLHEIWDFLVYPHSWKELFLITRIVTRFRPGERKKFIGKFFDLKTLKY
jgi:hypothetical protein